MLCDCQLAIGVTTGTVYCGNVGSAARCEYCMVGHSVNMAARLMGAAARMKREVGGRVGTRVENLPVRDLCRIVCCVLGAVLCCDGSLSGGSV